VWALSLMREDAMGCRPDAVKRLIAAAQEMLRHKSC
jgi:hypothetical protein